MNKISAVVGWVALVLGSNAWAFDAPAEFARAEAEGRLEVRVDDVSGEHVRCATFKEFGIGEACLIRAWITYPQGLSCEFTSDRDQHYGFIVVPRAAWTYGSETGYHIGRFGFKLLELPAGEFSERAHYGVPVWIKDCDHPIAQ